jgi:hypothetical protein
MICDPLRIKFGSLLIELGVAVHDASKIEHPEAMAGPGSRHETAGETLMLQHGVQPEVARCCITHAAWQRPDVTFEERTVALANKLWKGKREPELELLAVDGAAARLGMKLRDAFERLDTVFEEIAATGEDRLRRSRLA